jgi:N-methylhydantoinase B/oxoprolinase/acetone carboxylase alpha subunit
LERDPEKVRIDFLEGFVSLEAARNEYGVVLKPNKHPTFYEVDTEGTTKLRAERTKRG